MQIELRRLGLSLGMLLALPGAAGAEGPLSAIDWLSKSVAAAPRKAPPANGKPPSSVPLPRADGKEPAVTKNASPAEVTVSVLGAPTPDGVGLLSSARTGLPRTLWGLMRAEEVARLLSQERIDSLPALQGLMITLLLAEADPPVDSGPHGIVLLARIDKLLAMGALDQAGALAALAGDSTPELFRRRFDIALLTGEEDAACDEMRGSPQLAPTLPARIFCLARAGDWNAAALTLGTAKALGQVAPEEEALLSRFLDPELGDLLPPLPPPAQPTPLVWRIYEAIGEPLPTLGLPLAFSHAELRPQSGWKAQIEAAERLARAGAITPNMLLGLYTERSPAASGGVWDRVDLFQRFDAALAKSDKAAVAAALPQVWQAMASVELEAPFAALFATRLMELDLDGEAGALAFRIGLLSTGYETVALRRKARVAQSDLREAFLIGLARGDIRGLTPPDSMARGLAPAFLAPAIGDDARLLLDEKRFGEALLVAMDRVGRGVQGDPRGVAEGLSLLRRMGLEGVARRTALELLLLERRG